MAFAMLCFAVIRRVRSIVRCFRIYSICITEPASSRFQQPLACDYAGNVSGLTDQAWVTLNGNLLIASVIAADVTRREHELRLRRGRGALHNRGRRPFVDWWQAVPEWMVGPTSHSVDATSRMWEFLRQHPLTRTK